PAEKAEKVFPWFSLLDISTSDNMEDASGYNPFSSILHADKIDEKWKKAADAQMREIVLSEISGKTKPREEWEEAMRQYADIIGLMLYGKINYSLELYTSQMQFIMDHRQGRSNLISCWNAFKLLKLLAGNKRKELRYTIARYVLLEDTSRCPRFSIYDNETQQAVDFILKEFGNDPELVSKIKELEKERDEKQEQAKAQKAEKQTTEEEILAQMR
ncbi:MAG: hypothetical protein ACYC56_14810, partial [Candidatus Aquicultor sp.]